MIGLFGDSFGVQKDCEPFESWVTLLSKDYGIINHCECGVGEYKILEQLRQTDLSVFDHIIITHTSATRVHVKQNPVHINSVYHKNCDIIYADIAERDDAFSQACQQYFKYIFDIEYAIDIHNMICEKIDRLLDKKNVTHITHFDYTNLYSFPNMKNFYKLYLNNKGEVNHYNKYGNQQIYQTLKDHLCSE
jgi:hypothetical protein